MPYFPSLCIAYVNNPSPDTGQNVTKSNGFTLAPVVAPLVLLLVMTVAGTVAVVALLVRRHIKQKRKEEERM